MCKNLTHAADGGEGVGDAGGVLGVVCRGGGGGGGNRYRDSGQREHYAFR